MPDQDSAQPKKIISEAVLLAIASGYSYAVAYAYRSGLASFFGLPQLLLTPTLGVVLQAGAAIIAALAIYWLLLYSLWGFLPRASSVVGIQLRTLFVVAFFFALAFFSVLTRSKWGWLIMLGFVCVFGFGMFVFPLIAQREVVGYDNKLLAQQKVENAAQQHMLLDQIGERIGHNRMLLILAAIALLSFAHGVGYRNASDQEEFFVVADAPGYVVAAINDEMMVLAAYDPISLVLKKEYIVRRFASDHASLLQKKHIGKLKPST